MKQVSIIYDSEFNKSAILDIEALLIDYMKSDKKYKLQNGTAGISKDINYYEREKYLAKFTSIWDSLLKLKLANQNKIEIENQNLFKFSPYKKLTEDQYSTAIDLLTTLINNEYKKKKTTFIVNGGPGTGKSILAVYLMKFFSECQNKEIDSFLGEENIDIKNILESLMNYPGKLKIGLVVPMESLRLTLKSVFKDVDGLTSSMVIGPSEVVKEKYDVLIVDEAHRLRRRVNLMPGLYHTFDNVNKKLELDNGDELDWILKCSKHQILFYDSHQSIKPSDVRKEKFDKLINKQGVIQYYLTSQMRVKGGNYYISSIYKLLSNKLDNKICPHNYELKIFDKIDLMVKSIKEKDKEYGLCRVVSGYAWPWKTKSYNYEEINELGLYDIEIENNKYIWNHNNKNWVNSPNALNEIGCIHTIQGYDLNYVGVIIGPEIKYDNTLNKIYIDANVYYDVNGKRTISDEKELFDYIINIYKVLLTRGIQGTYIYICDNNLKEYFKRYIGG